MKKKAIILSLLFLVISVTVLWTVHDTKSFKVTQYTVTDSQLPEAFSGFRIAQISDLHNAEFSENNDRLLSKLRDSKPDIIVITGDIVDSQHTDIPAAVDLARNAADIAPTYYVSGNHEAWLGESYEILKSQLASSGVTVLENSSVILEKGGEAITLTGVDDPDFTQSYASNAEIIGSELNKLKSESKGYTVLLSHRPELFEVYFDCGFNLVFTGHAHGGQIRIPFIGALFAPGQGMFPKYDKGVYREKDTTMVVSTGLGNSVIPFRFNNQAELVVVELKSY